MIVLALLLLAQEPDAKEIGKLLSGLEPLFADSIKNADELDRRYVGLKKALETNLDAKARDAVLSWMARLARKTGRPAEGIVFTKERLKSGLLDARHVEGAYQDAIYNAALALKTDELVALIRALAKERPDSPLGAMREDVELDAKSLGRSSPVTAPVYDGSKSFSWSTDTKDKLVFLYFTATW